MTRLVLVERFSRGRHLGRIWVRVVHVLVLLEITGGPAVGPLLF